MEESIAYRLNPREFSLLAVQTPTESLENDSPQWEVFTQTTIAGCCVKLKITDIQSYYDESAIGYTVAFDDFDRGRCMVARVTESDFFAPATHPYCEAFDVELEAEGKLRTEKYETAALVRIIKEFIRDEASRENPG